MVNRKKQLQFLGVLLILVLVLTFFIVKPFLLTIIMAGIFAITLYPLYKKILWLTRRHEILAALLTVFIAAVCVLLPLLVLSTQIFREAVGLYSSLAQGDGGKSLLVSFIDGTGKKFEGFMPGTGHFFETLSNNVDVYLKQGLAWLVNHLGVVLSEVSSWALDLFIFFVSLYYLLKDGHGLTKTILKISPLDKIDTNTIFERLHAAVNSVIKGSLFIALLQGVLVTIGFWMFGVPNAALWGTVTVFAALVPGVGTGLVLIPGVIYLFIIENMFGAIGLAVWGILFVGLVDNLLRPKLVGEALSLHPLLILLSIIGGLILFGPIGLFLGPIIMSLLFAFIATYGEIMEKAK
jgi:predicted PurR-regulated permease PerM